MRGVTAGVAARSEPGVRGRVAALVIDNETRARNDLCFLLRSAFGVARVETARDSSEALRHVQRRQFDVVFTEVVIPGLDGIEVANVLRQFTSPPPVVIVTAHDEYAVRAFEVGACDYLLKPVSRARLGVALGRALKRTPGQATPATGYPVAEGGEELAADDPVAAIPVETGGRTRLIAREEVRWVEAQGDYVRLHMADGEAHLVRMPISRLEEMWADFGFMRIHRGYLVPFRHVTEFSAAGGNHSVTVAGQSLPVSRRHARNLRDRFLGAGWRVP
ncbi:MAG: response regulator transcription factor [Nocardiopsaceae bacterium]|nr:response regulator transcription factor [Nocardiopsaceae bacterium]